MTLHASMELRQVIAEAKDIAKQVSQEYASAHLLLALFTVQNRAEILLKEMNIDEDQLLMHVHKVQNESPEVIKRVMHKARQIAAGCGAETIDCLHMLIALIGMRNSVAYDLLRLSGKNVSKLRNTALSYVTGNLPRRFTVKKKDSTQSESQYTQSGYNPPVAALVAGEAREEEDFGEKSECAEQIEYVNGQNENPTLQTDWDLDPEQYPALSKLGRNITSSAALGKVDVLVGREREITEVIDTLLKRRANNPLLVGEPGVGKTAIVEGLALKIVQATTDTRQLHSRRIVEFDVAALLAGTQLRGSFSEKLKQIREEVKKADGSVVIFFDEMHMLMGAGSTGDGPQDAANELKSSLARGEFPCIGATTYDEYRRFVEQDAALTRRFQIVRVNEPSPKETLAVLEGVAEEYANHHGVSYDREALEAAVALSSRYITDRCLPDKAISLLDLAGSRARRSGKTRVDREAVARVVATAANIPVERLLMTDGERLLNMEKILGLQIIGHTGVVRAIAKVIRRNYVGFINRRPIGSFLFLGPTGVGKTECARALAQFLFSSRDAMVKLDMTEYAEPHSVARLVGSPPGYVGYQEGGQLTDAVRRRPYTIVLFDEVEKAHPEVQQLLLQVLDEGRLTDGRGRTVDFTNVVVILTTNLGARQVEKGKTSQIGFGGGRSDEDHLASQALEHARKYFPPELWARMDEHLVFRALNRDDLCAIASLVLKESAKQLESERKMKLMLRDDVAVYLADKSCTDLSLGARPIRAAVRRFLEEPLAEAILQGRFADGDHIQVSVDSKGLAFGKAGAA